MISALPNSVASHAAAAALWGLCDPPQGPIEVTATDSRRARSGVRIHRGRLPRSELSFVDGIPVTGVARTLLDLAAVTDARRLRRLAKQAEFMRLTDAAGLAAILERYPRRRGRRGLAQIIGGYLLGAGRTRSELEDRFLEFCAERDLPPPETNKVIEVAQKVFEVDCVWREARLIVELDGRAAHRTEAAFEEDRARDRALIAAGWSPMRVTWSHLHGDPDTLERQIRDALDTRLPHQGGFVHTEGD